MKNGVVKVLLFIALVAIFSCSQNKDREFKIGVATFSHETCTFCPNPTGIAEWEYYGPPMQGDEVLRADS